jgi:hypothetical protein
MRQRIGKSAGHAWLVAAVGITALPGLAFAQAASPFLTGATSLQTNILAWLTPVAVILVMVLGGMAMANRIIRDVGIGVDSTLESDDVGLDISPNQRVVVSCCSSDSAPSLPGSTGQGSGGCREPHSGSVMRDERTDLMEEFPRLHLVRLPIYEPG